MLFKGGAAVYGSMAVHAGTSEKSITGALPGETTVVVIGCTGMARPVMAILAEIRQLFSQQLSVQAAMGGMAIQAILCDRRMFVDIRSSLIGMTGIAELLGGVRLNHVHSKTAVGLVT